MTNVEWADRRRWAAIERLRARVPATADTQWPEAAAEAEVDETPIPLSREELAAVETMQYLRSVDAWPPR